MKLNLRLNDQKYEFFDIKGKKKSFQINSFRNITNKTNNYLNQLYSNLKVLSNSKNANNFNTCNSNRLRIISLKNKIFKLKNKNKSINLLFKNNNNDNNNKINNKKFILLTSLYKLPVINNKTILNSRSQPHSPIHSKTRNINISSIVSNNTSQINANKNFNESINSSNESFNKFLNVCFNSNDISKISNESNHKYKKRRFSSLSSSLKEKLYSDIERRLDHKLDVRSFPSDHSIKDKIIHMKKVSIFWDCVFRYCCPIINGQKYNFLRLEEQRKLNNIKLSENDLSYISPKRKKNYIIKSISQPKLHSPKIKNNLFLNINEK